jgi:hypothetical protein
LIARRNAILSRYLTKLSPIADLAVEGDRLCGVDLARRTFVVRGDPARLAARYAAGEPLTVRAYGDGAFCVDLRHTAGSAYRIVEIANGYAEQALYAHLYDLGPRAGFRLVGIARD